MLPEIIRRHFVDVAVPVGLAVFGAAIALVCVWLGNRHSRKLALITGAFKHREIVLAVGSYQIRDFEIWCFCFPDNTADMTFVEIPLQLVNGGELTCEGVIVNINTAKDLLGFAWTEEMHKTHKAFPALTLKQFERMMADTDETHRHVSYSLPPLHKSASITLNELFCLKQTIDVRHATTSLTKDGKAVEVGWKMSLGWPMEITAIATDCDPVKATIEIYGIRADTDEEALRALLRVAKPKESTAPGAAATRHHLRIFHLKARPPQVIDRKKTVIFDLAGMKRVVVNEPIASLSMKPKVEVLDLKPGDSRKIKKR